MSIDPTGSQLKRSNSSDLERHITDAEVGGAAPVPAVPAGAHGLQRPISDRVEQLTLASGCCTWVCLFLGGPPQTKTNINAVFLLAFLNKKMGCPPTCQWDEEQSVQHQPNGKYLSGSGKRRPKS